MRVGRAKAARAGTGTEAGTRTTRTESRTGAATEAGARSMAVARRDRGSSGGFARRSERRRGAEHDRRHDSREDENEDLLAHERVSSFQDFSTDADA